MNKALLLVLLCAAVLLCDAGRPAARDLPNDLNDRVERALEHGRERYERRHRQILEQSAAGVKKRSPIK